MSTRVWERAARLPVPAGAPRRAELVALSAELPTVDQLFTFMRDAELRFQTLRMRISERVIGSRGEQIQSIELLLRHPGAARVTTSDPARATSGNFEVWASDGVTVRTYSGTHRLGTQRPVRPRPRLGGAELPASSLVYVPLTPLPAETLPDTFVHPAGLCQNILATGVCRVVGTADQAGREAIVVESDHPRTTEARTDTPDHRYQVTVDRETGVITRLMELVGDIVTRDAEVTSLEPDAALPPAAFDFTIPPGTTMLY